MKLNISPGNSPAFWDEGGIEQESMKITEYLSSQHDVFLEELSFLERFKASQKGDDVGGLKEITLAIAFAVERHAELEEKFLFPELNGHLEQKMGPVAVMEFEHEEIWKILQVLKETEDPQTIRLEVSKFIVFLRDHIAKEEKALFVIAEESIDFESLEIAAQKIKATGKKRDL